MTTVKGTEVVLKSFQERLKNVLENVQGPRREGEKPIADLLFQFTKEVTGYVDVAVMHIDKLRLGSGSPYSTKKRFSLLPPKVVSILGEVDGVSYCCRKGEPCEPDHDTTRPYSAYPQVKVMPQENVSEKFAHTLIGEMIKRLESFVASDSEPVPQPCNGFVIKQFTRSTDGSMGTWKFIFIEKSMEIQSYKDAITAFSLRQTSDAAQKKLQRVEKIFIYAGQWISVMKNLSKEVSVMDSKIAGITPTELGINGQSESATA